MAVLCRSLGLLFLCVPKTGCSAIAKLLIERYEGEWLPSNDILDNDGRLVCGQKHCTLDELIGAGLLTAAEAENLTVAATTRDPLDWLLSQYYYSRSVYGAEGENTDLGWVSRNLYLYRHAATSSFEEHVRKFWLSRRSVADKWTKDARFVLRYEHLQADFDAMMNFLGVATPELVPLYNETIGRPLDAADRVAIPLIGEIASSFAMDYRRYGYLPRHRFGADARRARMLYLDDLVPAERLGFGYPRSFEILNELSRHFRITLFPTIDQERREPESSSLRNLGVEVIHAPPGHAERLADFIHNCRGEFDVIWVSRLRNLKAHYCELKEHLPDTPIVFDSECLTSYREIQRLRIIGEQTSSGLEQALIRNEVDWISKANLVLAVSETERSLLAQNGVSSTVLGHKAEGAPSNGQFEARSTVLFLGRFGGPSIIPATHLPNEDAYSYLREIHASMPTEPRIRFVVAGTGSDRLARIEGIELTGQQRWLEPLFQRARLFVAPTRFSGGIPLKVLDALARGVPVVTTPHLAAQLGPDGEEVVRVAISAERFAEEILRLWTDEPLWKGMREKGIAYATSNSSAQSFAKQIAAVTERIAQLLTQERFA